MRRLGLRREAERHAAFVRTKSTRTSENLPPARKRCRGCCLATAVQNYRLAGHVRENEASWTAAGSGAPRRFSPLGKHANFRKSLARAKVVSWLTPCHRSPKLSLCRPCPLRKFRGRTRRNIGSPFAEPILSRPALICGSLTLQAKNAWPFCIAVCSRSRQSPAGGWKRGRFSPITIISSGIRRTTRTQQKICPECLDYCTSGRPSGSINLTMRLRGKSGTIIARRG